jgi:hypothetical protein
MHRPAQTLRDEAVLERKIGIPVATDAFIRTPRERTVVNDYILVLTDSKRIAFHLVLVSHTEAHVTDDDVARFDDHRISDSGEDK